MIKSSIEKLADTIGFEIGTSDDITQAKLINGFCKGLNNIYSIFNQNGWKPKAECFNGNKKCRHESAPRGSRTGTQGLKGNYERSKIPEQLCREVILATSTKLSEYCI